MHGSGTTRFRIRRDPSPFLGNRRENRWRGGPASCDSRGGWNRWQDVSVKVKFRQRRLLGVGCRFHLRLRRCGEWVDDAWNGEFEAEGEHHSRGTERAGVLEEGRRGQASGTTNLVSSPQRACTTARRNPSAIKWRASGGPPARPRPTSIPGHPPSASRPFIGGADRRSSARWSKGRRGPSWQVLGGVAGGCSSCRTQLPAGCHELVLQSDLHLMICSIDSSSSAKTQSRRRQPALTLSSQAQSACCCKSSPNQDFLRFMLTLSQASSSSPLAEK